MPVPQEAAGTATAVASTGTYEWPGSASKDGVCGTR